MFMSTFEFRVGANFSTLPCHIRGCDSTRTKYEPVCQLVCDTREYWVSLRWFAGSHLPILAHIILPNIGSPFPLNCSCRVPARLCICDVVAAKVGPITILIILIVAELNESIDIDVSISYEYNLWSI